MRALSEHRPVILVSEGGQRPRKGGCHLVSRLEPAVYGMCKDDGAVAGRWTLTIVFQKTILRTLPSDSEDEDPLQEAFAQKLEEQQGSSGKLLQLEASHKHRHIWWKL